MGKKISAGIDIGSRTIKLAFFDGEKVINSYILDNNYNIKEITEKLLKSNSYDSIMATGYGRSLLEVESNIPTITEIKAFACGCEMEFPGKKTILDIGGQDTKIIKVNEKGKVIKFEMNDRCAAGTGKFFEVMAKTLNYDISDFSNIQESSNPLKINSMCTVFAESEVITMLSRGEKREDIVYALHKSIVKRIIPKVMSIKGDDILIFCGGCAHNKLLRNLIEKEINQKIFVPENPQLIGAIGASILSYRD